MGSIFSSSTKIYKIDVYKSPTGGDQTVVYSTTEAKSFTLHAVVQVQTAYFSLMDYTCTSLGTGIEIMVHLQPGIIGGINLRYQGDVLNVWNDAENVAIHYGVRSYNLGIFHAKRYSLDTGGTALMVFHLLWSGSDSCLVLFVVWYDVGKGCFVCELIGPFRRPTLSEIKIDLEYTCRRPTLSSNAASSTGGYQTALTGLINNLGGPVLGNYNGAINYFNNNYYSNR